MTREKIFAQLNHVNKTEYFVQSYWYNKDMSLFWNIPVY
jgi:hypothetical protein